METGHTVENGTAKATPLEWGDADARQRFGALLRAAAEYMNVYLEFYDDKDTYAVEFEINNPSGPQHAVTLFMARAPDGPLEGVEVIRAESHVLPYVPGMELAYLLRTNDGRVYSRVMLAPASDEPTDLNIAVGGVLPLTKATHEDVAALILEVAIHADALESCLAVEISPAKEPDGEPEPGGAPEAEGAEGDEAVEDEGEDPEGS